MCRSTLFSFALCKSYYTVLKRVIRAIVGCTVQLDGREGALTIVTRERLQLRHVAAVVPRAVGILVRVRVRARV